MEKIKTPSNYMEFLESDLGRSLHKDLSDAIDKVKPFKTRALIASLVGIGLTIIIKLIFKSFVGLIFLLPAIYFIFVLGQESAIISNAQTKFNKNLLEFIFGQDYLSEEISQYYLPMGFMNGLPNFSGLFRDTTTELGKFGRVYRLRITRTFIEQDADGKEKREDKTSYEQGNIIELKDNSLVKDKKAFFYFNEKTLSLTRALGIDFKDKREFSLTDTELSEWFEVSVGGLKGLIKDDYDEKFFWTKILTPYFESLLKSLVVIYGQFHLVINDGFIFAFVPKKEAEYSSAEYGRLDIKHYNRIWAGNKDAEIISERVDPKAMLPYLYKLFLNRILDAMNSYFFTDHNLVSQEKLDEAKWIIDYTINEINQIDKDEMQEQYKNYKTTF